jgi:hypothetical protein
MGAYELILNSITPEVSFGYTTIHIYRPQELEAGQLGYSVSPTGESLVGAEAGSWKESWLVIGYDETCGDPIFIDRSEDGYPVYTAMPGQGQWTPQCIGVSLNSFAVALSALAVVAQRREYPVALERNPLTPSEKHRVLATIGQHNPNMDLHFWETLLSDS